MKHRPQYHFLPEKNWMNDPNATIFFNGEFHLFYQYNPTDWHWGSLHYGHAVSKDLLHWDHMPIAMRPDYERGETMCYSGCSYIHDGHIELLYTSVGTEKRGQHSGSEQWVATTKDEVLWKQIPENPVITNFEVPEGITLTEWRDPFVFKWEGDIFCLVAGVVNETYSAIHLYRTDDYRKWTYVSEFFRNSCKNEVMECPNLVVFGDKVLLIHSIWDIRVLKWFVGEIDENMQLKVLNQGAVDYGDFFASQIAFSPDGRAIMFGWLREDPRRGLLTDGEWAGTQAIPRVVSVNEKNEMVLERLPEFVSLRGHEETVLLRDFSGRQDFVTSSVTAEIEADIISEDVFSIRFLSDSEEKEFTQIIINPREGTCLATMEESSLLKIVDKRPILGYFENKGKETRIDILIDCSVAEVFINGRACMTLRIYPTLEGSGMSLLTSGKIESAKISIYEIGL